TSLSLGPRRSMSGAGVAVAIVDTFPVDRGGSPESLGVRVVDRYVDNQPHGVSPCPGPQYAGWAASMPDHGPFVASIVRSAAPGAEVTVYRAFTNDGVSDLHTIASAVQDALDDAEHRGLPLVINLSGGFSPHPDGMATLFAGLSSDRTDLR